MPATRGMMALPAPAETPVTGLALSMGSAASEGEAVASTGGLVEAKEEATTEAEARKAAEEPKAAEAEPPKAAEGVKRKHAKNARLSVLDTVALISKKLDERKADKAIEKAAAKAAAKPEGEAKAKAKGDGKKKTGGPRYTIERSRNGVQCWTGKYGPGQYHRIPFGDAGEEAAVRKAEAWVRKEKLKLAK